MRKSVSGFERQIYLIREFLKKRYETSFEDLFSLKEVLDSKCTIGENAELVKRHLEWLIGRDYQDFLKVMPADSFHQLQDDLRNWRVAWKELLKY